MRLTALLSLLSLQALPVSARWALTPAEQETAAQNLASLAESYSTGLSSLNLPPPIVLTAINVLSKQQPNSIEKEINEAREALKLNQHVNKGSKALQHTKAKLAVLRTKLGPGVGRFIKATLENEYFGHTGPKGERYVDFEQSVKGVDQSTVTADQRITDRLKLIKMFEDNQHEHVVTDSTSHARYITEYTQGKGDGSYRDVNSVTRTAHARPTYGVYEMVSRIWRHGIFKPVLTTETVDACINLDRALKTLESWSGRVFRATTFVPLLTLGGKEFVIDLGFLSTTKVNILFSDPDANINMQYGSIPDRDWGTGAQPWNPRIGLEKIRMFCGETNGGDFDAKNCNLLVIHTKNGKAHDISKYSKFKTEAEVLFQPGSIFQVIEKFKCTDVDKETNEQLIVKYELFGTKSGRTFARKEYANGRWWNTICDDLTIYLLDEIVVPVSIAGVHVKKTAAQQQQAAAGDDGNGLLRNNGGQ